MAETKEEVSPLRLESVDCVMQLPVVEAAFRQGASAYDKIKGANYMFTWALTTAETTVQKALETAAPYALKLDKPIQMVDQGLIKGIQMLRLKAPIVEKEPQVIYDEAISMVTNAVKPTMDKVCAAKTYGEKTALTLKELSWNKANELLSTQCGQMAVTGIDSATTLTERLIDRYFPATEEEANEDGPISAVEDPVLHTVQTVGRLSNKAARRLYRGATAQLKALSPLDVKEYVSSLVVVLQLTRILGLSENPPQQPAVQPAEQKSKETSS